LGIEVTNEERLAKKAAYMREWMKTHPGYSTKYVNALRLRDPDLESTRRFETYKRKYGITRAEYEDMLERQGGRCAICGVEPRRFYVDHDHDTDTVRALLCSSCNVGIGLLQDDPELLRLAALYIEAHQGKV
jgi:hypothetical protein